MYRPRVRGRASHAANLTVTVTSFLVSLAPDRVEAKGVAPGAATMDREGVVQEAEQSAIDRSILSGGMAYALGRSE